MLNAQAVNVSGRILSGTDDQALSGVSITVEGTSIGTTSASDGTFSLNVPEGRSMLLFTYVGMVSQSYAIDFSNPTGIEVFMEKDLLQLDELIVMGYSSRVRNSLTGSTVQVKAEQFKDIPVTSVDQALQGKVAGLVVSTTSGTPGAVQDIRIRGMGSLTVGNEPLIVVDGVPVINQNLSWGGNSSLSSLCAINSSDIESITVLKDASATSAYGARGSNGVIVIKTKNGNAGATVFDVSYSFGVQDKASRGHVVLTGKQREKLFLDGIYHSFGQDNGFTRDEAFEWALEQDIPGAISYEAWHAEGSPEGDWEGAMTKRNAPVTNVLVSASGGDPSSSFYVSAGYNKTEATVVGNDFRRINGTLNLSRYLRKRVLFSTTNRISNIDQHGIMVEQFASFSNPHVAKYFLSPTLQPRNQDGSPKIDNPTNLYNWLYLKDNDINTNHLIRAMSNNYLEVEFLSGLKYRLLLALDYILDDRKGYSNRIHGDGKAVNGSADRYMEQNSNLVFRNSLAYNLHTSDHRVQLLALTEYQVNNNHYLYGRGENFLTDGLTNIGQATANWDAESGFTDWMHLSYLCMANYNYKGKYFLDATYRREGSSKFPAEHRYGNFWSVGAAWNISQESFISKINWINSLRIRTSYGITGNSDIEINQYQALLSYDATYAGKGAVYPGSYGSPFLTWEKNATLDMGLDFAIVEGRIHGSCSYFRKETYDLLQEIPLSMTSGHSGIVKNTGSLVNRGIEAMLDFDIIRSNRFNLSISSNLATLHNEVKSLARNSLGEDLYIDDGYRRIEVGHPVHEWHMKKWAGVDPANGDPLWYKDGISGETTNEYSAAESAFLGKSAIPTYSGGIGLHMDFKGVFLDAYAYFAGGHMVFEDYANYTHNNGLFATEYFNGVTGLTSSWTRPGQQTDYPKIYHGYDPNYASYPSSRFLYEGNFTRLKDLVLGYNLPGSLVSRIKFSGIQIYCRGTNLATRTRDDRLKYDPEVRANGFTYLTTPPVKSILLGINFRF